MTLKEINEKLGFDFWEKYEEYLDSGTDDFTKSPINFLTDEEIEFLDKYNRENN